jgi:hypothetical protein
MSGSASFLERAVIRDRWFVLGSLLFVAGGCWAWIVPMSRDMYGDMTGRPPG